MLCVFFYLWVTMFSLQIGIIIFNQIVLVGTGKSVAESGELYKALFYHELSASCLQLKQDHHYTVTTLLKVNHKFNKNIHRNLRFKLNFTVRSPLLFSKRCMVVLAPLAEGIPTIVVEEMEVALVIRGLVVPLAFPALLAWGTVAPTALVAVEGVLEEQVARRFPWRISSPSTLHMPRRDQCT